jgi:hypothetical protein
MKPSTLQSSNNPKLFISNQEQRPIYHRHVDALVSSMSRHGFFPSKPIQCYPNGNGKYTVVDGHHRLEAAKQLGCMFYYVVETKRSQDAMPDVNAGRAWKNEDFVRQYSMRGLPDYIALQQYISRGLPLRCAVALLGGESAASSNKMKDIKSGAFKVKTTDHAEKILSLIERNPDLPVFRHSAFIKAISMLLWVRDFDIATFQSRIEGGGHKIPNCSNVDDFLTAIDEVCNYRVNMKDRKSFVLLAKQAVALRNPKLPRNH